MILRILSKDAHLFNEKGESIKIKKKTEGKKALKFDWKKGLKIFEDSFDIKMIPKEMRDSVFLKDKKVYHVKTDSGEEILLQPIQENLNFLVIDDDGIIRPKNIEDLSPEDSIFIYSGQEEEEHSWIYDDIYSIQSWYPEVDIIDENEEIKFY